MLSKANENIADPEKCKILVGLAGFEPTTFTRKQRLAAPTGFSMTAPELRHPRAGQQTRLNLLLEPVVIPALGSNNFMGFSCSVFIYSLPLSYNEYLLSI